MSMKLLILGILMEKDRHPYEIRQTMINRSWNYAFRLRDGSLYYAVDQLRDRGLIEAVHIVPVPGEHRPDKTIYRITDAGRQEFDKLMYAQLGQPAYPQHPMMMAMPFLRHADQARVAEIAGQQLAACEERIASLEQVLAVKASGIPASALRMIEGMLAFGRAERDWMETIIGEARSGAYDQERDPSGGWRAKARPPAPPTQE
ncbi:helix-turn-helix transcriptional regulator [Cohnella ginsengisoli]|uniref:Helix-turn-helix transcriptional regulator n=1 Tax=Cohnella ginsengisoli TaxID=425004 RepID=A0A9X4QLM0_9BACL|nr:PadR family transcriptional regulator [Cohnella ginsengisoli]MDG0790610.1 helix-turn-helix transcriptional regulator [Cohnella ginsengisoli]